MKNHQALVAFLAAVLAFFAILLIAIFASGSDGDLDGSWTVEAVIFDGEEFPTLEGAPLTAVFEEGEITGSAGCNSFFGSYEVDGEQLAIGPLGSTQMFCEDPPQVMDQEFAYLTLLGQAESFSVSGDALAIRVGGGDRIAYTRD